MKADAMFNFERWRDWLEERGGQLKAEGFETQIAGHDFPGKPKASLAVAGHKALGDFENWKSGETDYTIMRLGRHRFFPWRKMSKQVSYRWGVVVDDNSFEPLFEEFISRFREVEAQ
jgi:hypothetical protein